MSKILRTSIVFAVAVAACSPAVGQDAQPAASQPAAVTRKNPLPWVEIDRKRSRVCIDAVTLQPGLMLELLIGAAPNPREHECIATTRARPQHIHLALLLCGFEAGHPACYDEKAEKTILPAGDRIDILVCWKDKDCKDHVAPIERWMTPIKEGQKMPDVTWLFAGSVKMEDGDYAADIEGTVAAISNFPDALIALSGEHTDLNELLEFRSDERTMPPAGTACKLTFLPPADLRVELDRFGKVSIEGKPIRPDQIDKRLVRHFDSRDDARVVLTVQPDALEADVQKLAAQLRQAGFADNRIERQKPAPTTQPGASVFPTNDPRAAIDLLTRQFRRQREAFGQAASAQRDWLVQMNERRHLLARQYDELTDYIGRAGRQYRGEE